MSTPVPRAGEGQVAEHPSPRWSTAPNYRRQEQASSVGSVRLPIAGAHLRCSPGHASRPRLIPSLADRDPCYQLLVSRAAARQPRAHIKTRRPRKSRGQRDLVLQAHLGANSRAQGCLCRCQPMPSFVAAIQQSGSRLAARSSSLDRHGNPLQRQASSRSYRRTDPHHLDPSVSTSRRMRERHFDPSRRAVDVRPGQSDAQTRPCVVRCVAAVPSGVIDGGRGQWASSIIGPMSRWDLGSRAHLSSRSEWPAPCLLFPREQRFGPDCGAAETPLSHGATACAHGTRATRDAQSHHAQPHFICPPCRP